jgi:hypothetical protein
MPSLTLGKKAIVDLVTERGPMTEKEIIRTLWPRFGPKIGLAIEDVTEPRGLLLEHESTVECERCGGSGQEPQTMPRPRGDHPCQKCKGTGSEEQVIGLPCRECNGAKMVWATEPGVVAGIGIPCPRCTSTTGLHSGGA